MRGGVKLSWVARQARLHSTSKPARACAQAKEAACGCGIV